MTSKMMKMIIALVIISLLSLSKEASPSREIIEEGSKYENNDYVSLFRIPNTLLKSYSSSGGERASNPLSNAFDGNWGNWFISGRNNDNEFKTEVTVNFRQTLHLEGMMYQCQDYYTQGYPNIILFKYKFNNETEYKQFQYQSPEDSNKKVIFHFGETIVCDEIVIRWESIYKGRLTNVATAREFVFFQPESELILKSLNMFNYNYLELTQDFNTEEKLQKLEEEGRTNINFETAVRERLTRARGILAGAFVYDERREFRTSTTGKGTYFKQLGDVKGFCSSSLKTSWGGTNRQPTGIYGRSGDQLIVYLQADSTDKLPGLAFAQFKNLWNSWLFWSNLKIGRNIITYPNINTSGYGNKVAPGGPIYINNPYTPEQQSANVKIYFETGILFPIFRKGDNQDKYCKFVDEYLARYKAKELEGYFDMTELVGDRTIHTIDATRTVNPYKTENATASLERWDYFLRQLLEFDGEKFNPGEQYYDPRVPHVNLNYRYSQPYGAAYAINEHVGIFGDGWLNSAVVAGSFGWGFAHEMGHMFDLNGRTYSECTNNMWSKYHEDAILRTSSRGSFETYLYLAPDGIEPLKRCGDHSFWKHVNINFNFYWHIESLFHGYWGKFNNYFRYGLLPDDSKMTNPEKQCLYSSLAVGADLSTYFERWGYDFTGGSNPPFNISGASQTFKDYMTQFKASGNISDSKIYKLWYLDRFEYNQIADIGFNSCGCYNINNTVDIERIIKTGDKNYLLVLPKPPTSCKGHLGYEISINNTVKNFTYDTSILIQNVDASTTFSIAAYDRILNCTKTSTPKRYQEPGAVCKIGNTNYNDLQAAFDAVTDGQTIELLSDIHVGGTITFDKNISITITHSQSKQINIYRMFNGYLFSILQGDVTILGKQNYKIVFDGSFSTTGRLIVIKNQAHLTAQYVTIQNSSTNEDGGGIQVENNSHLYLNDSLVTNCKGNHGGGVHFGASGTRGAIFNVQFQNNNGSNWGSGLRSVGTVNITGCSFTGNIGLHGGALSNDGGGVMRITNTTFSNNEATGNGVVYMDGFLVITSCTFNGNHAQNGGAIYQSSSNGSRTLELLGVTKIYNNYATDKGGALYFNKGKTTFTSAEIHDNRKSNLQLSAASDNITQLSESVYINTGELYLTSDCKINGYIYKEINAKIYAKGSMPSAYGNQVVTIAFALQRSVNIIQPSGYTITNADLAKIKILDNLGKLTINSAGIIAVDLNTFSVTINNKKGNEVVSTETMTMEYGNQINATDYFTVDDPNFYLDRITDGRGAVVTDPIIVTANLVLNLEFKEYYTLTFDYIGTPFIKYAKQNEKYTLPFFRMDEDLDKDTDCNIAYYKDELGQRYEVYQTLQVTKNKNFTVVFNNCYEIKFMEKEEMLKLQRVGFGTDLQLPKKIGDKVIKLWKDQYGTEYKPGKDVQIMEHMTFEATDAGIFASYKIPIIIGIVAAVIVIGVAIFFIIRCCKKGDGMERLI